MDKDTEKHASWKEHDYKTQANQTLSFNSSLIHMTSMKSQENQVQISKSA